MRHLTRQELALVGVTVLWGVTFLIIRNAVRETGPLFFVGVRFACAVFVLGFVSAKILRGLTLHEVFAGAVIGSSLFAGFALQTAGLQTISASKSAFITAFYVPAVPVLQWVFWRRKPHGGACIGVALAFVGLVLMAGPDELSSGYGTGELLTFLSAVAFAFEILLIGLFAGSVDVRRVVIVQVGMASLWAFILMPVTGESVPPFSWVVAVSACGLGLLTAVIQNTMNWAQRSVSSTRAAIIYAGEPVWAGVFGRIAGEVLSVWALFGGVLIVSSVLVSGLKKVKAQE